MPVRRLPVRPDLDALLHEAGELHRSVRAGDAAAIAEVREHLPALTDPASATLAEVQSILARSYQAEDWPRLVLACELADAIWRDDVSATRALVERHPTLLTDHVLIRRDSNWGPPMSYAANLGRDDIITMLHELGATDHLSAMGRAVLQGKVATTRMLHRMLGSPTPPADALGGAAYTLSASGAAVFFELGGSLEMKDGRPWAPVETVLQTDSRKPEAKHAILEMFAARGFDFPDTPPMALHRGRIDLLEQHLHRDPGLLSRTFSHQEIYPPEVGCRDEIDATTGTPLGGTTLLHMCVDYDELEIAQWLLDRGVDVNARAATDADGFGGYTALFCTVVSQPNFWMNYGGRGPFIAPFTQLLLDHGADPNVRASLWKRLHPGHGDPARHEYRDVTALSWGQRFHAPIFVSEPAMRLIEERGGRP